MGITHTFVSVKPDSSDPTLINPSNWNAGHSISVTGILVGTPPTTIAAVAASTQGQYLRRRWNTATVQYEFATPVELQAKDFNFTAIAPTVNLSAGVGISIAISNQLLGFNTLSVNKHYVRIVDSNPANTETVLLTAGTTTGTLVFTPTISHTSGQYTITSATSGIQEAIVFAVNESLSSEIVLGPGSVQTYSRIYTDFSVRSITIRGLSEDWSIVSRDISYPSGPIFFGNGSANGSIRFQNFRVYNNTGSNGQPGGYGFDYASISGMVFDGVTVYDGKGGFSFATCSYVRLVNCKYFESADQVTSGRTQAEAGLYIKQTASNFSVVGCFFETQYDGVLNPNKLLYGIALNGYDGVQIVNSGSNGQVGIRVIGGFNNCTSLYVDNHISDNCVVHAVQVTGTSANPFVNLRIANSHLVCSGVAASADVVKIDAAIDWLQIIGCNIGNSLGGGISVIGQNSAFGAAKQSMQIQGNYLVGLGLANIANISAMTFSGNCSGVSINGNRCFKQPATTARLDYMVAFGGNIADLNVTGNGFADAFVAPMYFGGTITRAVIDDNTGIDDIIGTVASAASVAFPVNPMVKVTGTTGVGAVTGLWAGRRGMLVTTSGAVTFTVGASIAATKTTTQNVPIPFFFDGTLLYLG